MEFWRKFLRAYFRLLHSATFEGHENIPTSGPLLFASNHQSYYDPMLVACGQDLPMRFMAWDALFIGGFSERILLDYGAFPVDPDGSDPGGYRDCLEILKRGERVLIFPEGGRTDDGKLLPFREGTARLAMKADVPVVPVCICGAYEAWSKWDFGPRPFFPIRLQFLPAIYPRPVKGGHERHEESQRIMREITKVIQRGLDGEKSGTANSKES